MKKEQNRLGENFSGAGLLLFAMPTIIMMVFSGLYTIVDTLFVARFVNTDALSAVNIVTPLISLTVGIGTMLAAGGNAVIARNMGEGKKRLARENFTLIVLCGVAAGIVFALAIFTGMDRILNLLGARGVLFPYARDYLGILLFFIPAYMLQTIFANLFVTAGRPGLGMAVAVGAGILNILLDYVFIVIYHMGIGGAALGTGFGVSLTIFAGIIFFIPGKRQEEQGNAGLETGKKPLCFCKTPFRMKVILESCFNGSSEMVGQLAAGVTTLLFNLSMLRLAGKDGVAAITIMNYMQFLFHGLYIGFSMGVAPVIGYHYGAVISREGERISGASKELHRIIGLCIKFILAASIGIFLLSFLGSRILVGMFTGASGQVYQLAAGGMKIFSFSFLFSGFNIFISAMFTALSKGKMSALLSFLRTFVLLAAAILILPCFWGVAGLWLAAPAAEFAAFLTAIPISNAVRKGKVGF